MGCAKRFSFELFTQEEVSNMKKSFIKVLFLFAALIDTCTAPVFKQQYGSSRIKTPYGEMRGLLIEFPRHSNLQYVEGYFGLQYASIQTVSLRFSVPNTPKERWNIVRVFKNFNGPVCTQPKVRTKRLNVLLPEGFVSKFERLSSFAHKITEDCLRLNMYVPKTGKCLYF
ncbi:unnamed protein product [Mytilus coruscus]|uniref:Carboxylesterase type B domain-containing protein n=1 Tax=Mytilus coruscus TaxID=42192 RepID=A0A6J8DBF4_MYTCO|nr:unnamed protein product [Mytilus coruscus]